MRICLDYCLNSALSIPCAPVATARYIMGKPRVFIRFIELPDGSLQPTERKGGAEKSSGCPLTKATGSIIASTIAPANASITVQGIAMLFGRIWPASPASARR